MSDRLDAAFAAARDHLAEKDQRIQFLEAAMATVFVNLRRAPEKAMAVATFASAIMRGVSLQEAVTEAEKEGEPSSIVEVSTTPSQGLGAATVERCAALEKALRPFATHVGKLDAPVTLKIGADEWTGTLTSADFWNARNTLWPRKPLATEPHQHGGKGT